MNWIEVLIATVQNISTGAAFLCFLSFIGTIILTGMVIFHACELSKFKKLADKNDPYWAQRLEETKSALSVTRKFLFLVAPIFMVSGAISALPNIDDLWKVRIGLIKLQLASPENVQKGADVIERLGKKLECKYLGCEEKK